MLHDFVTIHRDAIILRAEAKVVARPPPLAPAVGFGSGLPLMLTQLSQSLRLETAATPFAENGIGDPSVSHVGDLLALGFSVSQLVCGYDDICQAIAELAFELRTPIAVNEFQTLDFCVDKAIAEAVTQHVPSTPGT
jgi:hypothetical protein